MASKIEALIDAAIQTWDQDYTGPMTMPQYLCAALREAGLAVVPVLPTDAVIEAGMASDEEMRLAYQGAAVVAGYRAMVRAANLLPGSGG